MNVLWPNFSKRGGLCVAIAQDFRSGEILMQGFVDEAGYIETLQTGEAVYFTTSRNQRWKKGETSGDVQVVKEILLDCDGDSILYIVEQLGDGACHTKARSCFYRSFANLYSQDIPDGIKEKLEERDMPVAEHLKAAAEKGFHDSKRCARPDGSVRLVRPGFTFVGSRG